LNNKDKKRGYLNLDRLEVYVLSCKLSAVAWEIYSGFDWQNKKIIGDQFIRSTDSVGANIAEGFGRYHYLDKIKFYYNARASLKESRHWIELIKERELSEYKIIAKYLKVYSQLSPKLNAFIRSCYKAKKEADC